MKTNDDPWPSLPFAEWQDTATTLHMWTQIVGKIRLTLSPWTNHSWHVTLYVTSRGLTTSPIPHGLRTFEITFDFIDHQLHIDTSDGDRRTVELKPRSVADFYRAVMRSLDELHLPVSINKVPNEIQDPIPFDQDEQHRSYDREYANRQRSDGSSKCAGRLRRFPDRPYSIETARQRGRRARVMPLRLSEVCSLAFSMRLRVVSLARTQRRKCCRTTTGVCGRGERAR